MRTGPKLSTDAQRVALHSAAPCAALNREMRDFAMKTNRRHGLDWRIRTHGHEGNQRRIGDLK